MVIRRSLDSHQLLQCQVGDASAGRVHSHEDIGVGGDCTCWTVGILGRR